MKIFRYEVPVDDEWHPISLFGDVVHVGCRRSDVVEFWAEHDVRRDPITRRFRVFGTGQDVEPDSLHVGTVIVHGGALVWHLREAVKGATWLRSATGGMA